MIRIPALSSARLSFQAAALLGLAALTFAGAPAQAQAQRAPAKPQPAKTAAAGGQGQALLLETAGKWQAFSSQQGRSKICYALSKAETRVPANLKDVEGLLFISSRPGEGVRNEISLVMNFDLKEDVEHQAIIGSDRFALVAKGQNVWLKNPAEEGRMLDALRKGAGLEIKGTSKRGNATSDKYSLAGISQIVKRAEDACK
ncbi:invasion associated locus B family protein [Bosea sp. LjRoot237]|uniref:invasion associated locus B family protein n=1 Tax=Bosea sp. LjRoot237 TaxID=3342292 RepID=UPI003ECFEC91